MATYKEIRGVNIQSRDADPTAVEGDVWWYYMIELTFYWSLTFSQFYDVKRKGNEKLLIFN